MIRDSNLVFDPDGTAITASAASTNVLDLKNARDLGVSECPLDVAVITDGNFAAAGAGTLTIAFQGAPDNGSGAPGTYTTYAQTSALSIAQLNSGGTAQPAVVFPIKLPARMTAGADGRGTALPRFLRLNYTVATGPFTAGALTAFLNLNRDVPTVYPAGFSVSN